MGYYNHVFKLPDRRRSKLRAIGNSFRKKLSRIKWAIWLRGGPVKFTYDDARAASLVKHPICEWIWEDETKPGIEEIQRRVDEDIIPWLHDAVTRAPTPKGIDGQGIILRVYKNDKFICRQCRMVDKYGWRKAGKNDTRTWLIEALSAQGSGPIGITAFVGSVGRVIATHGLAKPYKPPSLEELDNRSLD